MTDLVTTVRVHAARLESGQQAWTWDCNDCKGFGVWHTSALCHDAARQHAKSCAEPMVLP